MTPARAHGVRTGARVGRRLSGGVLLVALCVAAGCRSARPARTEDPCGDGAPAWVPLDDAPGVLERATARLASPEVACRRSGLATLARLGPRAAPAVTRVSAAVTSGPWADRPEAAEVLGAIGAPEGVPVLRAALASRHVRLEHAAATALGALGAAAQAAVPVLESLAQEHWAWEVRASSASAVERITGRRVTARPPACRSRSQLARARLEVEVAGRPRLLTPVPPEGSRAARRATTATCFWLEPERGEFPLHERGDTCFAGIDLGEFGGRILAVEGRSRTVLRDGWDVNPRVGVQLGTELLVLEGLSHMGSSRGLLSRLSREEGGAWREEPALELPGEPLGWGADGEDLLVLAEDGLAADAPPCPAQPGQTRRAAYLLRIRPDLSVTSLE